MNLSSETIRVILTDEFTELFERDMGFSRFDDPYVSSWWSFMFRFDLTDRLDDAKSWSPEVLKRPSSFTKRAAEIFEEVKSRTMSRYLCVNYRFDRTLYAPMDIEYHPVPLGL